MKGDCIFSPCRRYRYTLWRDIPPEYHRRPGYAQFICLNPSTADETKDDPTVRRCTLYAQAWGYERFLMTNLFAFRATDPREMKAEADPVGAENDYWIGMLAEKAGIVVAAWGTHGRYRARGDTFATCLIRAGIPLHYLKLTKHGHPQHPLYLRKDLQPQLWRAA